MSEIMEGAGSGPAAELPHLRPDYSDGPGSLAWLYGCLSDEASERFCRQVLEAKGVVSEAPWRALQQALRRSRLRVAGFRDATKAPAGRLTVAMARLLGSERPLWAPALQVWYVARAELRDLLAADLDELGVSRCEFSLSGDSLPGKWSLGALLAALPWFESRHPEQHRDDIGIMLCCLTGCAPLPDE